MSKVGKKDKGRAQTAHALRRASQRLGLTLNESDLHKVIKDIQSGKYKCVEVQSNRVSKFKVTIKEVEVVAVYDKLRKTLVTFLELNPDPFLKNFFNYQEF